MEKFLLKKLDSHNLLLLCLNHNSVLSYLGDVSDCEEIKYNKGVLIIDQLLVVGDGRNRFISCYFSNGNIQIEHSKVITKENDQDFRKISSELLKSANEYLEYSILTDKQRELIADGGIV